MAGERVESRYVPRALQLRQTIGGTRASIRRSQEVHRNLVKLSSFYQVALMESSHIATLSPGSSRCDAGFRINFLIVAKDDPTVNGNNLDATRRGRMAHTVEPIA